MKSIIIIAISIFLPVVMLSQEIIDYNPKKLFKELEKNNSHLKFQMEEIFIDDDAQLSLGKFFKISNNQRICNYVYIGRVNSCRSNGCSISDVKMDSYEYFDYYILFNLNKEIESIKVYNYQATYGHEVCSKGWLKQFVGYDGSSELIVGKNFDAISNATISVYSISDDIQSKTRMLKLM